MPRVSSLQIKLQSGTENTYYATWDFKEETKTSYTTVSSIRVGSLVTIKSGARYYNGVSIPSWVLNDRWYVTQVRGDRAVLGRNQSGSHNIRSPINVNNLNGGTSASTSTTTTQYLKTLDKYEVKWYYDTGNGVWFNGGSSDTTDKNATYSSPNNAIKIKVTVKPVSKTYQSNGNQTYYWTGTSVSAEYSFERDEPLLKTFRMLEQTRLSFRFTTTRL